MQTGDWVVLTAQIQEVVLLLMNLFFQDGANSS